MKEYKLYLPTPANQDIICERWKHLFNKIDREFQEVRILTAGFDFPYSTLDALPYATMDGKKKTYENLYNIIMVDSGLAEDEYIPKDYDTESWRDND